MMKVIEEINPIEKLINHWKGFVDPTGCKRHPSDDGAFESIGRRQRHRCSEIENPTLADFLQHPSEGNDLFHLSLSPVPYVGDLRQADIVLLMRNPSVGIADYGTNQIEDFQKLVGSTRDQTFDETEYARCFALNPRYWWSSWFNYYEELFRSAVWQYVGKQKGDIDYPAALENLASRLAILELVPYYSRTAYQIRGAFLNNLGTAKCARAAAQYFATKPNVLLIARWGEELWELPGKSAAKVVVAKGRKVLGKECENDIVTHMMNNSKTK